jgi:hypothetical protein
VLLAAAAVAQEPATLAAARKSHALELARLSDSCLENKLLNDAGRLLSSALLLVPKDKTLLERQKRLREAWISINRAGERREAYKRFWRSDAYKKACRDLEKREQKVRKQAIQKYLVLAAGVGKNDAGLADAAFRQAFDVDPTSQALASRAGKERMAKLRRQRPGLDALQLGATVVGKPTDLKSLRGKVVLWRSFSL